MTLWGIGVASKRSLLMLWSNGELLRILTQARVDVCVCVRGVAPGPPGPDSRPGSVPPAYGSSRRKIEAKNLAERADCRDCSHTAS